MPHITIDWNINIGTILSLGAMIFGAAWRFARRLDKTVAHLAREQRQHKSRLIRVERHVGITHIEEPLV